MYYFSHFSFMGFWSINRYYTTFLVHPIKNLNSICRKFRLFDWDSKLIMSTSFENWIVKIFPRKSSGCLRWWTFASNDFSNALLMTYSLSPSFLLGSVFRVNILHCPFNGANVLQSSLILSRSSWVKSNSLPISITAIFISFSALRNLKSMLSNIELIGLERWLTNPIVYKTVAWHVNT